MYGHAISRSLAQDRRQRVRDLPWLEVVHLQRDRLLRAPQLLPDRGKRLLAVEENGDVIAVRQMSAGEHLHRAHEQRVAHGWRRASHTLQVRQMRAVEGELHPDDRE